MTKSLKYNKILPEIQEAIIADRKNHKENPFKCQNDQVIRRDNTKDFQSILRPAFLRDSEKILHLPTYNRYTDKTQVFSFFHNDDISRRALHVQIVSQIARSIGSVLGLNLDLIEAISLGHDLGHTPFGHLGEKYLSTILKREIGEYFNHNVHSVRVLEYIFKRNVSLQTLDGILCHNGEFEQQEYKPRSIDFSLSPEKLYQDFDNQIENCNKNGNEAIKKLVPITLEACVVRICDMIAYLGKDRQDAITAKIIQDTNCFSSNEIGTVNAEIINNLSVDIINNSYGKNYIYLSPEYYQDLKTAKKENYELIYFNPGLTKQTDTYLQPMMEKLYYALLDELTKQKKDSYLWQHHIDYIQFHTQHYSSQNYLEETEPHKIIADYIASMSDDYFIEIYKKLFPNKKIDITYKTYFE